MRFTILAIGKLKKTDSEENIIQNYIKNSVYPIEIKQLDTHKKLPPEQQKKEESDLLLKSVSAPGKVVVLDERGTQLTSREFSEKMVKWQDLGCQNVYFLIGGAYGHTPELRLKADLLLSLGKMTMPHFLARVVLTEQIYRAGLIAQNHPYHKD